MIKKDHLYFMRRAIKLSLKARGNTSPNPMVGALVVKNNKIISEGFHEKAGLPHAEVIALDKAGPKAKGARLYITLEPCAHFGRTPPCVDKIIRSGIKEVYIGMIDPNPANNGKGIESLKKNGIKVEVGFFTDELKRINEAFIKYITQKIPFITVKVGQSLDGKIATASGDSHWVTSDKARLHSRRLRKDYDAIMVGVNTILRDNPKLDAWFSKRQPIKVVVDSNLSTPLKANIFGSNSQAILVTLLKSAGQETENRKILSGVARIMEAKEKDGQVNVRDMLKKLAQIGIINILVEGGGTLNGTLFDEGLVDKVHFYISPKIIGGKDSISSVMGKGVLRVERAIKLKDVKLRRIGEDFLVEGYLRR